MDERNRDLIQSIRRKGVKEVTLDPSGVSHDSSAFDPGALRLYWQEVIGHPQTVSSPLRHRVVRQDVPGTYTGSLLYIESLPGEWLKCYLAIPVTATPGSGLPCVVVHWYDIDTPLGVNLGSREWSKWRPEDRLSLNFAQRLINRGFVVLVQRWSFEARVTNFNAAASLDDLFGEAAADHHHRHPSCTGMGRLVWDDKRVVDFLCQSDFIDPHRIGSIGHSMGAKCALYQTAFDDRIAACAVSEPGLARAASNWDAEWYLGQLGSSNLGARDHDELLAMIAPRPFLLVSGSQGDAIESRDSRECMLRASTQYLAMGVLSRLSWYEHSGGHTPTLEATEAMCDWLASTLA